MPVSAFTFTLMRQAQLFSHLVDQQAVMRVEKRWKLELGAIPVLQKELHLLLDLRVSALVLLFLCWSCLCGLLVFVISSVYVTTASSCHLLSLFGLVGGLVFNLLSGGRCICLSFFVVVRVVLRHNVLDVLKRCSDFAVLSHMINEGFQESVILDSMRVAHDGDVTPRTRNRHIYPSVFCQKPNFP